MPRVWAMARAGYRRVVDVSSRAGQFPIMRVHAGVLGLECSIGWRIQRSVSAEALSYFGELSRSKISSSLAASDS